MNAAFREALAARFLWTDYLVILAVGGREPQVDAAYQAAHAAVAELASNDVLSYRHYGPAAPQLLQDVPDLADHYNLAHEMYSELYHQNYHAGLIGEMEAHWLPPAAPLDLPYSKWIGAVTRGVADLMNKTCPEASVATSGLDAELFECWRNKSAPADAAATIYAAYQRHTATLDDDEHEAFMSGVAQGLADARQHKDHWLRCSCVDHGFSG